MELAADRVGWWLGPNFTPFRTGTGNIGFRSVDGLKQIRFDIADFHGDPRGPHINLDVFKPRNLFPGDREMIKVVNESKHIYFGGK